MSEKKQIKKLKKENKALIKFNNERIDDNWKLQDKNLEYESVILACSIFGLCAVFVPKAIEKIKAM